MARHECGKRIYPNQDTALSYALRHSGRYGKPMRAYACHLDRSVWHLTTKPHRTDAPTTREETH
jgi:hypothetical protein